MSDPRKNAESVEALPQAKIRKSKRLFSIVWVVPLAAAIAAGVLVYDRLREWGPQITVRFNDGSGLRSGQTQIRYRGVPVGEVTAIELSEDLQHALVKARLRRSAASIARDGAVFWIVRPQVGLENITGLGTVLTGPEIQVLPGSGEPRSEFTGLDRAPAAVEPDGLKIVLRASRLGSLKRDSPVYYRGIEVGAVAEARLTPDATAVDIHVVIGRRYAALVRSGSKFWIVGGVDVSGGLLRGVEIKVESLRSLVVAGIAFATPEETDKPAPGGMGFLLYSEPRPEWLQWAPKIRLPPEK